jgi:hypothetical protein
MTYIPQEENTDMELTLESQEISTKQQSWGDVRSIALLAKI